MVKELRCIKCKELTTRKDSVEEVTGEIFCKSCYFGQKVKITISVDKNIFQEMKEVCSTAGQKVSSVINLLIHKIVADSRDGNVTLIKRKEDKTD